MTHICHWPGCGKPVQPRLWGCREHWLRLPGYIRRKIWDTYVPAQEIAKTPTGQYLEAAKQAQDWIRIYSGNE